MRNSRLQPPSNVIIKLQIFDFTHTEIRLQVIQMLNDHTTNKRVELKSTSL